MKVVIFEVWTRYRVVEAESAQTVRDDIAHDPEPIEGLSLSNWHVVGVDEPNKEMPNTGCLNYQQVIETDESTDAEKAFGVSRATPEPD